MDTPLTNLALLLSILALAVSGYLIYAAKEAQKQIALTLKTEKENLTTTLRDKVYAEVNPIIVDLRTQFTKEAKDLIARAQADATDLMSDEVDSLKLEMTKKVTEMIGMAAKGIEQSVDEKLKILIPRQP